MPLSSNCRLGRYEIRFQIGAGGMGEVYLAQDTRLERTVALKILPADLASDEQRMRRFTQEAKAASALNHPNIITIHEIDQVDSTHFIATEYIEGMTLREHSSGARIEIEEVLDIATQVASALSAAHRAGIVHRDVKPENIMLRRDGYVKVLDFGLAKLTSKSTGRAAVDSELETKALVNTSPGMVMGTVSYMSPEQARGLQVDARTDVWSLGVLLYEMIAGGIPFKGETVSDAIALILHREPAPLVRFAPEVPAELERIVTKALTKDRESRYQTAQDMLIDLRRLKQRLEFEAELERTETPEGPREKREPSKGSGKGQPGEGQSITIITDTVSHASQASHPNNLSVELSPLIGREQEIASVERLLRREEVRLVTLTGIGGTGKTRLAQQVARQMLQEFSDGVFFIDLATITDSALVASSIAQPLGVQEAGGKSLIDALKEFLKDKQLLLVLDNFEQVTNAASLIKELLSISPHLKVLVTSREQLHLSVEQVFSVPPLALPSDKHLPSTLELMEYAAIALFVERAAAAKPGFALNNENARAVVDICSRLDGLPLAIELAAARVKVLQPQAILARLENRLKLLTGGARDLPTRQQTMRGAISWSYDLLDAGERQLLNRIAVFAGGATLEAVEAVCNAAGDLEVDVLDGVISLVDKSLLMQKEQADGVSRFRLLEIVREYALEQLQENGEIEVVQKQHALFFLSLAEEAEPELTGARQSEWLDRLEEEHDNLRAALQWTVGHDAEIGLRLAGALRRFWGSHGHLTEGRRWLKVALEKASSEATHARAKALVGAGGIAWNMGDLEAAQKFFEECLEVSREMEDKPLVAQALNGLGIVAHQRSDFTTAYSFFEECLKISKELGDTRLISIGLGNLGEVARTKGDMAAARSLYEEGLALSRQIGNKDGVAINHANLGSVTYEEGDFKASLGHYTESLALAQELGDKRMIGVSLDGLAALATRRGEWERAAQLAGAADALRESIGFEIEPNERLFNERYRAEIREELGDETFSQAFATGRAMRIKQAIALALAEA